MRQIVILGPEDSIVIQARGHKVLKPVVEVCYDRILLPMTGKTHIERWNEKKQRYEYD